MKKREKRNKKVVVAMSGGVDSSVAAALLKRAGFDVVGVFMKLYNFSTEAEKRTKKVAKILKIPFYIFNFEKEFKKRIVDYFLREYKKGRTPNPCVACNKEIKFGLFIEKALKLNADFIATGHYARTNFYTINSTIVENMGTVKLLRARDKKKDQGYFLWPLNQKQLRKILFPVGDYTKTQVRNLAKKFGLPVLNISESQEICFVQTKINDFLKKYIKEKPGPVVERVHYGVNKIIGRHEGLHFYTIGQRKGIKLPAGPYWVLDKNLKKNLLIVTKNEKDLYRKKLICKNVNWITGKVPKLPLKIKAKIRYRHTSVLSIIYKLKAKNYKLIFDRPQRAITPGQSVVFYSGQELLGGGIIC